MVAEGSLNYKVSIVIPLRNDDWDILSKTLIALNNQIKKPNEVIFIDSSDGDFLCSKLNAFKFDGISSKVIGIDPSYAGKSTNIGISRSKHEIIGFLDSKTIPHKNWIQTYCQLLQENNIEIVFGSTIFHANSYFESILLSCSYGRVTHKTLPGTLFLRAISKQMEITLREDMRAGYDIEWKDRIESNFKAKVMREPYISYASFPNNIFLAIKKYFFYSFHSSKADIQSNVKGFYLSLLLIFTSLLIPRWNYLLPGWENHPLYVDDITKKYFLIILLIFIVYLVTIQIFHISNLGKFFKNTLYAILFLFIFYSIYRWNALIANWAEGALLYIPHITKIFLVLTLLIPFLLRGIFLPIRRKVPLNFIFPFNWLVIGGVGLLLDLVKMPGYVFGGLLSIFRKI